MKVGIVIPTLGQNLQWLEKAIASCRFDSTEYLVVLVCKSPTPELQNLCTKYQANIILESGNGVFSAINDGVAFLSGQADFFTFIGDDDQLFPGAIPNLLAAFGDDSVLMTYGIIWYFDKNSQILFCNPGYPKLIHLNSWIPNLIPNPGALIRVATWKQLGGYNTSLKFAADLDFWIRLRKIGKIKFLKIPMSCFRWHENSLTAGQRASSLQEASNVRRLHSNWFGKFAKIFTEPLITHLGEYVMKNKLTASPEFTNKH